ncbi:MAG: DUF2130 domain-containing protein [Pedobacter sp.]|nr:DUF2130 domain-containing protein [Pedobacter sp.]
MKTEETTIKCPNCGGAINVNDILKHQIEDTLRKEYQLKANQNEQAFQAKTEKLAKDQGDFEAKKQKENELFLERVAKESKANEAALVLKVTKQVEEESKDQLMLLNKELNEKSEKLRELHKKDGEIAKLQREKAEAKDIAEAAAQKQFTAQLIVEKAKAKQLADEENELKVASLQKQLEDNKKHTADLLKKQEQGSMQLQGEIMELAIEEYLATSFPLDTITEVKKGANGADCMHIVNTRESQNCGAIYYESKRAKNFQQAWIDKFKADLQAKNAPFGILVTECLPSDMQRMGWIDRILVCTYQEFKGISGVVREHVIQLHHAKQTQDNKGDKMVMLYDFLTGNEFRMQVESIVDAFEQMHVDLRREKKSTLSMWTQREKQLDKVMHNTIAMHGAVKGIAGNAVQTIKALEFDAEDELLLENSI